MSNLRSFIFETMPQVLLLLAEVSVKYHTTVISQIRAFSLNLDTSNTSKKIKHSLARYFHKE